MSRNDQTAGCFGPKNWEFKMRPQRTKLDCSCLDFLKLHIFFFPSSGAENSELITYKTILNLKSHFRPRSSEHISSRWSFLGSKWRA